MVKLRQHPQLSFWLLTLVGLVAFVAIFRDILLPFLAGIVIAYFMNPLADALERLGLSRGLAATLIVGVLGVLLVLALTLLAPMAVQQIKSLSQTLPAELDRLRLAIEKTAEENLGAHFPTVRAAIERGLEDLRTNWTGSAGQIAAAMLNRSLALFNILTLLLITPLVAFYLLLDWHKMLDTVSGWLPRDDAPTIHRLAEEIDSSVAAFIRGQGTICLLLGVFYAIGLTAVGLRYGLVIGLGTGLAAFVPVLGWAVGLITAVGLAIAQFGFAVWPVLLVGSVLIAGLAIDTAFLSPRLVGERIGLHPVWLIFALFAFSYLFGFVGTLIAVPLAAATVVLVRHALDLYKSSPVYLGGQSSKGGKP